jgi:hypothetical protein
VTASLPQAPEAHRAAEEEAWAETVARWDDPLAHRAYLSRADDLEGLARAGARYREVLRERPDDPVAAAGRDEVLRRATVLGLASLPRTPPPVRSRPWVKYAIVAGLVLLVAGLLAGIGIALVRGGARR